MDFKTPVGTPVKATFDGTITRKNWFFRGNGNSLEVTSSGPPHMKAIFLHLSELPRTLTVGTKVKKGEVIAHSGNSGHSFAPHLHYQLMSPSDRVLDPFDVHATQKVNLAAADRPALTEQVAKWRSMMTTRVAATPSPAVVPRPPPRRPRAWSPGRALPRACRHGRFRPRTGSRRGREGPSRSASGGELLVTA